MIQINVAEGDVADNGILTSASSCLDTKSSVGVAENTILYGQIHNTACHFAA